MKYTKDFLISELHRFVEENGRVPSLHCMSPKFGYPSGSSYQNFFGSWNESLQKAGLEVNQNNHCFRLDGNETCCYCGCDITQTSRWYCDSEGNRYCSKHGSGGIRDYVKGELDINSPTGLNRSCVILVKKVLGIDKMFDFNVTIGCKVSVDLFNEKYGKIDVKASLLALERNQWRFKTSAKKQADTYICVGFSSDRKEVLHVWIMANKGKIKNLQNLSVTNSSKSLSYNSIWEVDVEPYNKVWQSMKLDSCKIMIDKKKKTKQLTGGL